MECDQERMRHPEHRFAARTNLDLNVRYGLQASPSGYLSQTGSLVLKIKIELERKNKNGRDFSRPLCLGGKKADYSAASSAGCAATSNRSLFITRVQALTKSLTNFAFESEQA